jgi:uncharacterized repeat protein (TIGR03943 family)
MGEPVAPLNPPLLQRAALGRALALGAWALVLLRSSSDGRLDLLLRAGFHPLVLLAGLLLLVLAGLQLRLGLGLEPDGAAERLQGRQGLTLGATLLLAGLLLLLPPQPSFATLAGQRPADRTAASTEASELSLPPAQRSLTDWVRLLRSQPDPRLFEGQPVRISGFVLPRPDGPPQLARLLVRCCLADAAPVGLPVRWPQQNPLPEADQWLSIEGVMAVEAASGGETLVVVPERIEAIPRPARPLEP